MLGNRIKPWFVLLGIGCSLITIALAGHTVFELLNIRSTTEHEHEVTDKLIDALAEARLQTTQLQQYLTDASATGEQDAIADGTTSLNASLHTLETAKNLAPELNADIEALIAHEQKLYATGLRMVEAYKQSRESGNRIMKGSGGFDEQSDQTRQAIARVLDKATAFQAKATAAVDGSIIGALRVSIVLSSILCFINLSVVYVLYRALLRQLGAEPILAATIAQQLKEGDFSSPIPMRKGDDISLISHLAAMRARWTDVVSSLRGQSWLMIKASNALSLHAKQLANNSHEQSGATAAIAANMEELSASIEQVALSANTATQQVKTTGNVAQQSREMIEQVVAEIQRAASKVQESAQQISVLDARANQIADIVGVIGSIAEQTNLLALNAAIEAARAGEAGRGFAVVSDEVRKLSIEATNATHSISTMVHDVRSSVQNVVNTIAESVNQVELGVEKSMHAMAAIGEIHQASFEASEEVSSINTTLMEQRANATDIANNLSRIASMIEQNSGATHDVSQAADNLDKIAKSIEHEVSYFKFSTEKEHDAVLF